MVRKTPASFGARVYALLLYLYPRPFRREFGDSMLQLFNDQDRATRGAGGYAMMWWKTLRDLVVSVPAAHSYDAARKAPRGGAFVWTVVVILGLVFLLNAVVLPSWIGRVPSDEAAQVVEPSLGRATGEYLAAAQAAAAVVSTLLALGALLFALRRRSVATGLAVFLAGAGLTFMALAMNPWLWLPLDEYPVAVAWSLGVWPLVALGWLALTIRGAIHRS
jgi:hypothetical protein